MNRIKSLKNFISDLYSLPIVAFNFVFLSLTSSCCSDTEIIVVENMQAFYKESIKLKSAANDSIHRFAAKFEGYVIKNPAEKSNPLYFEIKNNIKKAATTAGISIIITINSEWKGDTTIFF